MLVINQANLSAAKLAKVRQELAGPQNLCQLFSQAIQSRNFCHPAIIAEVIVQDEFTYDVIVPYRDGLTLVYDVT